MFHRPWSTVYLRYNFQVTYIHTRYISCVYQSTSTIPLFYLSIRVGPIIGTSLNITFIPSRERALVDKPSFKVEE